MEGFRFTMPYTVRIADINYGGHVANSAVLNFFQEARIAYLGQLGPFSELDLGGCGIILPEAQVRYRAEMFHGDPLLIGVRIESMKNSSMMMAYRIDREGQVVAEGTTALSPSITRPGGRCACRRAFGAPWPGSRNYPDNRVSTNQHQEVPCMIFAFVPVVAMGVAFMSPSRPSRRATASFSSARIAASPMNPAGWSA